MASARQSAGRQAFAQAAGCYRASIVAGSAYFFQPKPSQEGLGRGVLAETVFEATYSCKISVSVLKPKELPPLELILPKRNVPVQAHHLLIFSYSPSQCCDKRLGFGDNVLSDMCKVAKTEAGALTEFCYRSWPAGSTEGCRGFAVI